MLEYARQGSREERNSSSVAVQISRRWEKQPDCLCLGKGFHDGAFVARGRVWHSRHELKRLAILLDARASFFSPVAVRVANSRLDFLKAQTSSHPVMMD